MLFASSGMLKCTVGDSKKAHPSGVFKVNIKFGHPLNVNNTSAHDRAEHFKTGGGIVIDKITDLDKKLLGGLSEQFNPDQNEFDSSAPLFTRVEDSISSFGTSFVHNTPILLPTPSIPLPSSMSPVTPFTDIEPSTSALPISNTTPKQIQNVQVCNLAAPLRNTTPIPIPNQTSNTTTIPTPKTTKRKRQTEDLVNVIEERKKMKNKLAEIEWKKKEKDLDEERRQKQELHQFKMKYQETLIAGAEIDNEIKKIDLRIKQKQLYDLSL
ncbi:hypothetical protein FQR65_LT17252 [Abscondita terminalis]|nr:hypothetical protein FQR65_LT17252 [Abscondita terminalis]